MPEFYMIRRGETLAVPFQEGDTVLAALQQAGLRAVEAPCGGNGTCKKCRVTVNGVEALACQTPAAQGARVAVPEQEQGAVIASDGVKTDFPLTPSEGLGAAVDIGTTTLVVHLYRLDTGERLGTCSGVNAQRAYGADVISRIQYANDQPDGLALLGDAVRGQIEDFLNRLCAQAGRRVDELTAVTIAANTVMEHLYAGLSPRTIAVAPFTPLSYFGAWESGEKFGLPAHTRVYLTPAVAGYVGGDITAGIVASGAYRDEEPALFLDIGTNGEMALGCAQSGFLCCATAAGPAFEGAVISQGMSAQNGAIGAVEWANGALKLTVLGGGEAEGICGSGLVDALAVMLELGAVDETGRLLPPDEAPDAALPYLIEDDDGVRFCLTDAVAITEGDVRQLQLAKAAIAAGICTLLDEAGLTEDGVARLYLAGGFGNYIRKESAAAIGLLPASMLDRVVPVGNSAGQGAAAVLLSRQALDVLDELPRRCNYIELSGHKGFNDHYIDCMFFE